MRMHPQCLESRKPTALVIPPRRRVRCIVCSRLVRIVPLADQFVIAPHRVPDEMVRNYELAFGKERVYEGRF